MLLTPNDLSSSASLDSSLETLPTPALLLRVCGGEHDGELIRLTGRCCSVGSDQRCSLRLVSRAFEPLHLVIVRGPHGAVIRRWANRTRLNGQEFETSWLRTGDRLDLSGTLDLEVVDEGRWFPSTRRPTSEVAAMELAEMESFAAPPEFDAPDLTPSKPSLTQKSRRPRSPRHLKAIRRVLERRKRDLQARRDELSSQLQLLLNLQAQLARKECELVQRKQELDLETQAWQTRSHQLQSQVLEEQQAQERLVAERYAEQQVQLTLITQERDQLRSEVQQLGQRVAALSHELDAARLERAELTAELEKLRIVPQGGESDAWLAERAQLEETLADVRRQADEQMNLWRDERNELQAEFARLQAECDLAVQQFGIERSSWEQRELEYAAECDQLRRDLQAAQGSESVSSSWDSSEVVSSYDPSMSQEDSTIPLMGMEEYGPAGYADRETNSSLTPERGDQSWSSQTSESDWSVTRSADELLSEYEQQLLESEAKEELTFSTPSPAAPVDTAAILAKFGNFSLEDDDEPAAPAPGSTFSTPTPAAAPSSDLHALTLATRSAPREATHSDEERSIEDYMADLMRRVGSGPQAAFRPVAPTPPPVAPAPAPKEVERVQHPTAVPAISDLEQLRAQREKLPPINLSAMRDVANQTARVAIHQHVSRLGIQDAYWKLFLGGVGAMTAVGLAVLSKGRLNLPLAGSLVAVVVSGLWLYRGMAVYRVVRRKRQIQEANQLLKVSRESGQTGTPAEVNA